jgi:hypothetical protein
MRLTRGTGCARAWRLTPLLLATRPTRRLSLGNARGFDVLSWLPVGVAHRHQHLPRAHAPTLLAVAHSAFFDLLPCSIAMRSIGALTL